MRGWRTGMGLMCVLALTACAGSPESEAAGPPERAKFAGFSVEVPRGEGWHVERQSDQLTFHLQKSWMGQDVGSTRITISAHAVAPALATLPEEALASRFLGEEEARLLGEDGRGCQVDKIFKGQWERGGKSLYWMTYRTLYRARSDETAWADNVWESEGARSVWFPEGFREARFFSFLILDTNRECSPGTSSRMDLIDGVIRSFRKDEATPKDRPEPAPAMTGSLGNVGRGTFSR